MFPAPTGSTRAEQEHETDKCAPFPMQRPAVKAELSREKANMEQQIARQNEIIGTGDKMLQRAQRELSAGRIEQARVSIAGARSAFTRASASERLRDATRVEAQLAHFGNVADEPQRSPQDGAAGGQSQGQGADDSSPKVTGAIGTLAAATTAEKAAQTHAQTGALDQVGVTRLSWPSLPQTIHKAPAASWPLPEGTDGEWADGWARSRTASTPDALQTGSRSMLS